MTSHDVLFAELEGDIDIFNEGIYSFDIEDFFKKYDELLKKNTKQAYQDREALKNQYVMDSGILQIAIYVQNENSYKAVINLKGGELNILNFETKEVVFDPSTYELRLNIPISESRILRLRTTTASEAGAVDVVITGDAEITSNEPLYRIIQKGKFKLNTR